MEKSDLIKELDFAYNLMKRNTQQREDEKTDGQFMDKIHVLYKQIIVSMLARDDHIKLLEQHPQIHQMVLYSKECKTLDQLRSELYELILRRHEFLKNSTLSWKGYKTMKDFLNR